MFGAYCMLGSARECARDKGMNKHDVGAQSQTDKVMKGMYLVL